MTTGGVPDVVVITDRHQAAQAGHDVVEVVAAAVDAGAPAVLLRDKDMPAPERHALGRRLQSAVAAAGARLLVASDVGLAAQLRAHGLHLAAADPPCPSWRGMVGRSCHDRAEVVAARREGVAYAFVSPVAASASKPGHGPPLGPAGLRRLVRAVGDQPLLALGGVTPGNVADWRAAGAHGVAVMGGVMRATDPGAHVRALRAAWDTAAPSDAAGSSRATDPAPTEAP